MTAMLLYHFTHWGALPAIAEHGLTVGDVPTSSNSGIVGVWLTSASDADGHGLEGSAANKKAVRLTVEVPPGDPLHRWSDWAEKHCTKEMRDALYTCNGAASATWFIYLGWIKPQMIVRAEDATNDLMPIPDWGARRHGITASKGIRFRDRAIWHKRMQADLMRIVRDARQQRI